MCLALAIAKKLSISFPTYRVNTTRGFYNARDRKIYRQCCIQKYNHIEPWWPTGCNEKFRKFTDHNAQGHKRQLQSSWIRNILARTRIQFNRPLTHRCLLCLLMNSLYLGSFSAYSSPIKGILFLVSVFVFLWFGCDIFRYMEKYKLSKKCPNTWPLLQQQCAAY